MHMKTKDLSNQVKATYRMLRLGLAVIAFAFPLILWIGGYLRGEVPLAGSMSAYYHASAGVMRNEFVGILFAVGALLFAYQGYSQFEDWALNFAGVLALGIAVFPMKWPESTDSSFSIHGACAISFFVCIAYVCIWRSGDTLPLIKDEAMRERYRLVYRTLGVAMVVCPFLAWTLISLMPLRKSAIFFVELAGIYVFATYWVIKSHEARKSNVDEKTCRGKVRAQQHGLIDVLRPLPVAVTE
jgi:hypothetical protein